MSSTDGIIANNSSSVSSRSPRSGEREGEREGLIIANNSSSTQNSGSSGDLDLADREGLALRTPVRTKSLREVGNF
jgi:hypothetical protein